MTKPQLDLFQAQDDLFPSAPVVYRADPVRVRRKLGRILEEARGASTMPWDAERQRLYRKLFPQMSLALPEEEAAQYRLAFEAELERLA
ncbi:hypothetical protein [Lutibaculum baratangense]|uniref:Uncharacterized protein n=1 Tax=Lutibaculum baratangense AMV1 TaxID=631454 RepID=V4QSG3_9HYPH|nr:hypothetical protein [Lutibaculum baratangense]ESR22722.1 hypothetical protein N177_3859 [Lutibaculum baratangense AMV1]